jgi:preprotein translocase SecE subunit
MDSTTKPTFFEAVNSFFSDVWTEMRKVSWLDTQSVIKYTIMTVVVVVVAAAFLGGLDYLFSTALQAAVNRLG